MIRLLFVYLWSWRACRGDCPVSAQRGADNPFPAAPTRRIATADRSVDALFHAGRLHRVRDPSQAANRSASVSCRKKRAPARLSWSTPRARQRRVGHRGLRSAHRQADAVYLRAGQNDPETHAIHAKLPIVPAGGVGRVLFRDLQGSLHLHDARRRHRLRAAQRAMAWCAAAEGFAFISSNVAAQMSTTASDS